MLLAPWSTRAVQEAIDKQSRSNQRAIDLAMPLGKCDNATEERKTEMPVLIDGSGNMTHYPRKNESNEIMVSDLRSHIRELIEVHCDVELKNTLCADIDAYFIENNIDMKTVINR